MIRVAINGFGRIGRSFLRACFADKKSLEQLEIVAINVGPSKIEAVAHMFQYDTYMGKFDGHVVCNNGYLVIDGYKIKLFAEMGIEQLPWKDFSVDWVIESTGVFTHRDKVKQHIDVGAKKVLISAPGKLVDATIVMGVNEDQYNPERDTIISLASCTTNALAPLVKIIHESFGVELAFMNTIHSFTNRQVLMDVEADDVRSARSAVVNIIPSETGAAKLIDVVYPELKGCISGLSIRVPVGKVSLLDVVFVTKTDLSVEIVHEALKKAQATYLAGILDCTTVPLVSSDYINNPFSVIIDEPLTDVCKRSVKLFGWYDNEWGYANRIKDFLCKYR
jgi:glyceraldehyde 3-phosphate dehydrogenase